MKLCKRIGISIEYPAALCLTAGLIFGVVSMPGAVHSAQANSYFGKSEAGVRSRATKAKPVRKVTNAIAVMNPTAGNTAKGIITLTKKGKVMTIEANMTGLTPGEHGFHFHQYGDCTAADGTSAGPHFSPLSMEVGDSDKDPDLKSIWALGILMADENGNVSFKNEYKGHSFKGAASVLGTSIIVHESVAGARVACGVIGVAK